uniref:Uncharacterized protein n=1 Tax=Gibberella zeae (strain ATCC MYA-4620 / CBS 123657 / FGSC 9075 / NRRL 31084 / PH-1) TaxID=229533 RepID=A0A098E098_GIBZE
MEDKDKDENVEIDLIIESAEEGKGKKALKYISYYAKLIMLPVMLEDWFCGEMLVKSAIIV